MNAPALCAGVFAACLSGGCGAAIQVPADYTGARITTSERGGLRVLLSAHVGIRKGWLSREDAFGRVLVARDRGDLRDLWDELKTEAPRPEVDFGRYIVVAEIRSDDGCVDEVTRLSIDRSGLATLALEPLTSICILPLTTAAHVVAVPRARLPSDGFFFRAKDAEAPVGIALDAAGARALSEPQPAGEASRPRGPPLGRVPLPAPGQVEIAKLQDGTPLFVVRHHDGSATALPSAVPLGRGDIEGIAQALTWSPERRRFLVWDGGYLRRAWDELGRSVFGAAAADLPALVAAQVGDELVVYGGEGTRARRPIAARPRGEEAAEPLTPFAAATPMTLEDALAAGDGQVVVVDAHLVQYRDRPPALCRRREGGDWSSACPAGSPVATGVQMPAREGSMFYLGGPLAARIERGRFTDLVYLGGGSGSAALDAFGRSYHFLDRWRLTLSAALGGAGARGGDLFGGGTFNAGMAVRVPAPDGFAGALRKVVAGDTFGVDLRLRVMPGVVEEEAATLATLGVAPRLLAGAGASWRLPSALGLALPEIGWSVASAGQDSLYLGWSLPVQRRFFGVDLYGGPSVLLREAGGLFHRPLVGLELGVRNL